MKSWIKDLILLTLIIGTLFGATLAQYPLAAPDGARYAEIPREMVVTGDYVTPHLNGVKYFEKPPLFYWMQAASIKIFASNDFSVSITNAILAFGCAIWVYITGRKLYGRLPGLVGGIIFATTSLVFVLTRIVTLDVALTFFLTGSLCSFLLATQFSPGAKRTVWLWLMYALAASAVMTKGLIGIVFLGMILIAWLTICGEWRNLKTYHLLSGGIIFLLIAVPWHVLVQIKNPEFFQFYFVEQHFLRYLTDYASRSQKWWFLPAVTFAGLYPWVAFLPQTIIHSLPKHFSELKQAKPTIFLLLWIAVIYVFYTFSNSKLIPYILPIFPPIAILMGNYLVNYAQKTKLNRPATGFYAIAIINILMIIAAITATFILDFNAQAFTKQNLYTIAIILFINIVATLTIYRRYNLLAGFAVLAITTSSLWLYFSPNITTINRQSIKHLITTMQEKLKPENEVIAYGSYYQDLPFYLNRIVTVAGYLGELEFGTKHQDTSAWMIDKKVFLDRWNSDRRIYMIISANNYRALFPDAKDRMRIIDKRWDVLLVENTK